MKIGPQIQFLRGKWREIKEGKNQQKNNSSKNSGRILPKIIQAQTGISIFFQKKTRKMWGKCSVPFYRICRIVN